MAKKKSSRELYKSDFLNELRSKVIVRYLNNPRSKGVFKLKFSSDKYSKVYRAFNDQFENTIKTKFDGQTLVRFFERDVNDQGDEIPLDKDMWFERTTIDLLTQYVNTERNEQMDEYFLNDEQVNGCELVNMAFIRKLTENPYNHLLEDFYLAKNRRYCQWTGIACGWDEKRTITDIVIDKIKESYSWEAVVAAVIHGIGGAGKSTFLRQVTKLCVNDGIVVFWINHLNSFLSDDFRSIISSKKYLIIVDEWDALGQNESIRDFFLKISSFENIKIVIGDRTIEGRGYRKYVLGNNYFELTTEDNAAILEKAIKFKTNWQSIIKRFPANKIYDASIFIVLFVVAKESEGKAQHFTKDITGRFIDIIENDLHELDKLFPGLAKAFYHFARIYNSWSTTITWSALINLANNYRGNAPSYFFPYDMDNPACKILSRYFWLEYFVLPSYEDEQIIYFHNKTLVSHGLCQVHIAHFYFNQGNVLRNIVDVFYQSGLEELANEMLSRHHNPNFPTGDVEVDKYFDEIRKSRSFLNLLLLHHSFRRILLDTKIYDSDEDESFWISRLVSILFMFRDFPDWYYQALLEVLITVGCKSKFINGIYEHDKRDNTYLITFQNELAKTISERIEEMENPLKWKLILEGGYPMDSFPQKPPYFFFELDILFEM